MTSRPPVEQKRPWFEHVAVAKDTNVEYVQNNRHTDRSNLFRSIVAIPPIGAHHRKTWTEHGARSSWLDTHMLQHLPKARVLLYNFGELGDDKIDTLGQRLLNQLLNERKHDVHFSSIFFPSSSSSA